MIKSLRVRGLNRCMSFDLTFHEDINVLTGKNGSGKTTVLKLLWYAISGNLRHIIAEIPFESFELESDTVSIGMVRCTERNPATVKVGYRIGAEERRGFEIPAEGSMQSVVLEQVSRQVASTSGSSIFFPSFRRIEGGFSISTRPPEEIVRVLRAETMMTGLGYYVTSDITALQQAINQLSHRLNVGAHRFIASISTEDIDLLLSMRYADILEKNNRLNMGLSQFILGQIGEGASDNPEKNRNEGQARQTLKEIEERALRVTRESEVLLRPFTVLTEQIARILQYRGIQIDGQVTLGEAPEAIGSDLLSAGEKQMLSFLSYNAFANKSCIFIDEPEISLHVDWQRVLFPILLKQSTGNQFIVATHSPFIYSRYADKELLLIPERGDEDAHTPDDGGGDRRIPQENELADITG